MERVVSQGKYHIGVFAGWSIGLQKETAVLQARRCIDELSCHGLQFRYIGIRSTSKKRMRQNAKRILAGINAKYGTNYTELVFD